MWKIKELPTFTSPSCNEKTAQATAHIFLPKTKKSKLSKILGSSKSNPKAQPKSKAEGKYSDPAKRVIGHSSQAHAHVKLQASPPNAANPGPSTRKIQIHQYAELEWSDGSTHQPIHNHITYTEQAAEPPTTRNVNQNQPTIDQPKSTSRSGSLQNLASHQKITPQKSNQSLSPSRANEPNISPSHPHTESTRRESSTRTEGQSVRRQGSTSDAAGSRILTNGSLNKLNGSFTKSTGRDLTAGSSKSPITEKLGDSNTKEEVTKSTRRDSTAGSYSSSITKNSSDSSSKEEVTKSTGRDPAARSRYFQSFFGANSNQEGDQSISRKFAQLATPPLLQPGQEIVDATIDAGHGKRSNSIQNIVKLTVPYSDDRQLKSGIVQPTTKTLHQSRSEFNKVSESSGKTETMAKPASRYSDAETSLSRRMTDLKDLQSRPFRNSTASLSGDDSVFERDDDHHNTKPSVDKRRLFEGPVQPRIQTLDQSVAEFKKLEASSNRCLTNLKELSSRLVKDVLIHSSLSGDASDHNIKPSVGKRRLSEGSVSESASATALSDNQSRSDILQTILQLEMGQSWPKPPKNITN